MLEEMGTDDILNYVKTRLAKAELSYIMSIEKGGDDLPLNARKDGGTRISFGGDIEKLKLNIVCIIINLAREFEMDDINDIFNLSQAMFIDYLENKENEENDT